jgi:glycosyltransferase involved in cell wall biosynthesis
VVFLSTYPPRRCGIATFASDLSKAVGDYEVVALHRSDDDLLYPPEVVGIIRQDDKSDYIRAADRVSASGAEVVSVQHEYGIFGGGDGGYVIDFLDRVDIPAVVTLHTVLRAPTDLQRDVIGRVVERASVVVVMSNTAAALLRDHYDTPESKIAVIPHGVPDIALVAPDSRKAAFGLSGRLVILSFGLLGPGKGYEQVIEAVARIRFDKPDVVYVVLGATHPDLLRSDGEAYRARLHRSVNDLNLGGHVLFVDRFVEIEELCRWLQAADIFVTPYPNLDQIVSGSLSYALAAGRPSVSTPFAYASEVLSDGRGVLVEPNSIESLAEAISSLMDDPPRRAEIGRRAYAYGRHMVWDEVGAAYRALFGRVSRGERIAGAPRTRVDHG